MALRGVLRQDPFSELGNECAQKRRSEEDAGEELPDHGRLSQPLRHFAQEAGGQQQHGDLQDHHEHVVVGRGGEDLAHGWRVRCRPGSDTMLHELVSRRPIAGNLARGP